MWNGNRLMIDRRCVGCAVTGLLIAGLLAVIGGCGSDELPVAPVEGKVLYNGKPLEFGSVLFQPNVGPSGRGTIGPDGTFKLSTYGTEDGAVLGKHRIRIACFESQGPNAPPQDPNQEPTLGKSLIPRKYTNADTSGLEVEVKKTNEPFVFELVD